MPEKKVLEVTRVGFPGYTGDQRAPESLPFPACMTSLMEHLGEDYPLKISYSEGRRYIKRSGYQQFITVSGMTFQLLWHETLCPSSFDLTIGIEAVGRAFAWAGYDYRIVRPDQTSYEAMKAEIVASIDRNKPVLAFGVIGPPECSLIAGYDQAGEVLLGWSHFQVIAPSEEEPNGMFRQADWQKNLYFLVFPGEKTARRLKLSDVLAYGLSILEQRKVEDYLAGQAAYDAWIDLIATAADFDDASLKMRYQFQRNLLFSNAEARSWAADFLRENGIKDVAGCFVKIRNRSRKADAVLREKGWQGLREPKNRRAITELLREMQALDRQAITALCRYKE